MNCSVGSKRSLQGAVHSLDVHTCNGPVTLKDVTLDRLLLPGLPRVIRSFHELLRLEIPSSTFRMLGTDCVALLYGFIPVGGGGAECPPGCLPVRPGGTQTPLKQQQQRRWWQHRQGRHCHPCGLHRAAPHRRVWAVSQQDQAVC